MTTTFIEPKDIGRDIRHLVEKAYMTLSDDAKDVIGLDKFLNTLDRPELVLLVKQRNPKNIEEAVRAALEVESFMIRPGPDTGSAVTLVQSGIPSEPWRSGNLLAADGTHLTQSSIYLSSGHCVKSCAASTSWLRFPSTFRLHAGHSRRGAANRWKKSSATTARSKVDVIIEKDVTWPLSQSAVSWPEQPLLTSAMDHDCKLPVAIARAVVHPREGCVPVQLLNPSGDRVTIHRGNVVATTEAVDPLPLGRSPKTHTAILN
ncbi:hypothetical protein T02_15505 [Trichinella nativa]|uniref:Uncharacterized protein n=1 Tax=Trichinella nativa TaxID=6335 RepID=A0A0V1L616_9BILA|nr:hypothetical protein T02_15505 [Trichinella nativa]